MQMFRRKRHQEQTQNRIAFEFNEIDITDAGDGSSGCDFNGNRGQIFRPAVDQRMYVRWVHGCGSGDVSPIAVIWAAGRNVPDVR